MPETPIWVATTANEGSTGSVWVQWLGDSTITSATATTTTTSMYNNTVTASSTTTAYYQGNAVWVDQGLQNYDQRGAIYQQAAAQQAAINQQAVQQLRDREMAQLAEHQARVVQQRREMEAAEQRARELLIEHLTEEQRQMLEWDSCFIVIGSARGRYRINSNVGITGNVQAIAERLNLCAHIASGSIPFSDHLLAQKLWLEHDEPGFRRIANASRY